MGSLPWRRRRINFFDTSKSEIRYSPGTTSVRILSTNRYCSCGRTGKFSSVVLHWPLIGFQNHSHSISTHVLHFWGFLLVVVQIRDQLVWSMQNSDPGVRIVFVHRHDSDLLVATFNTGQILVFPWDPSCWLWCWFFSWKIAFTTSHCMKLWKICSVFRHETLSNFNNTQKSYIHTEFAHCVLLWQLLYSFSQLLQLKISIRWVITIQKNFDHTEHEWGTWLTHQNLRFSRSILWLSNSSHISATAP